MADGRFHIAPCKQFINGQVEPFLERAGWQSERTASKASSAASYSLKLLRKLLFKRLTTLLLKLLIKLLLKLRIRSLDKVHKEDAATR